MSRAKKLLQTYMAELETGTSLPWARKTEFTELPDGSMRRVVTNSDGAVEIDETITAERWKLAENRALAEQALPEERANRGSREKFVRALSKSPNVPPDEFDRL
ncbi:hypothetical protein [Methylomagnum sp.]